MSIYNDLPDHNSPIFTKALVLVSVIICFSAGQISAQSGNKATFRFLNVSASPKAASLGGGPVSDFEADPSMLHLNPAYLNSAMGSSLFTSYANYLNEVKFLSGGAVIPVRNVGVFGTAIRYVGYGEFDRTTSTGDITGKFEAYDMAFKVAYSNLIGEFLRYGLALDYIYSSYDTWTSSAIAFSGGLFLYFPEDELSFGLSILNAGSQFSSFDETEESLPMDIRIGMTRKLQYLPVRLSLTAHSLNKKDMKTFQDEDHPSIVQQIARRMTIGGEIIFSRNVQVRLGYDHRLHDELRTERRIDFTGLSLGLGIKFKNFGFDVSRTSHSEMGNLFQIGLRTRI